MTKSALSETVKLLAIRDGEIAALRAQLVEAHRTIGDLREVAAAAHQVISGAMAVAGRTS